MSCCVCRLPFLHIGDKSSKPHSAHSAPAGVLTNNQKVYFEHFISFGEIVPGFLLPSFLACNNVLGADKDRLPSGPVMVVAQWEQDQRDSVLTAMHTVCYDLFRRCVVPGEDTRDNLRKLAAVEYVLGRPLGAANAGRWAGIDYEGVGEKINLRPLWRLGNGMGENVFAWEGLARLGYDWLVNRPDIFPRFYREVTPLRLAALSGATRGTDALARQPSKVLRCIAAHLPDAASLVHFATVCRFMRLLSLTDWQPIARALITHTLPWAIPTPAETKASAAAAFAGPDDAGDWMLYLSHVHRTKSMRVRRWIWGICEEIKCVADAKLEATGALRVGTKARSDVDTWLDRQWPAYQALWHPDIMDREPELLAQKISQMQVRGT